MAHATHHFMNMRQSKALLGRGDTAGNEISDESSLHAQDTKATIHYINVPREDAAIPRPGMTLVKDQVSVVITDPQNDFLSPKGVTWGIVGQSVTENNTLENIESLFKAAKSSGVPVFISLHYYYPHDHQWTFEGALEVLMHKIGMFDRKGALVQEGFSGSGADWLDRYKPYINDGKTVVTSPHKIYGPESNDLVLQLRTGRHQSGDPWFHRRPLTLDPGIYDVETLNRGIDVVEPRGAKYDEKVRVSIKPGRITEVWLSDSDRPKFTSPTSPALVRDVYGDIIGYPNN